MNKEFYELPDGRVVGVDADVSRDARSIGFTLANGRIVQAYRYCVACDREGATAGAYITALEYHTHGR